MANVVITRTKTIQIDTASNVRPPNVIVAKQREVNINPSSRASLVDASAGAVLSNPTMSTRLDRLRDVDASNELEGATLVYDVATGKYVVSYIDLKYVRGTLAGGTF